MKHYQVTLKSGGQMTCWRIFRSSALHPYRSLGSVFIRIRHADNRAFLAVLVFLFLLRIKDFCFLSFYFGFFIPPSSKLDRENFLVVVAKATIEK
jgi:hypothetical protein